MEEIKYEVIRKGELEPDDIVLVHCPQKDMTETLKSVEHCFHGFKLRIIGVPTDLGIKLEFMGKKNDLTEDKHGKNHKKDKSQSKAQG